jgi:hypothetical protein
MTKHRDDRPRNDFAELFRRAAARGGILTPDLFDDLGIPRSTGYDRARELGCVNRHRRVLTIPGTPWDFRTRCAAAVQAVGPPVLVTGAAGLHLYGALTRAPKRIHLLKEPHRGSGAPRGVDVTRTARFAATGSLKIEQIPVACPERCCVDASQTLGQDQLIYAMVALLRLRQTDLDRLEERAEELGRFPGCRSYRAAVEGLRGGFEHTNLERIARAALAEHELDLHPEPYLVRDGRGRKLGEIDIANVEIRHGIETDGPVHLLEEQQRRDRTRDTGLRNEGWRIDRYLWHEVLANPAAFAAKVAADMAARRRELGL